MVHSYCRFVWWWWRFDVIQDLLNYVWVSSFAYFLRVPSATQANVVEYPVAIGFFCLISQVATADKEPRSIHKTGFFDINWCPHIIHDVPLPRLIKVV